MQEDSKPVVLLIGECQSPQFRSTLSDGPTADIFEPVNCHHVKSLADAISVVGTDYCVPDVVVAYQSVPDEYAAADIDQLIGMLPLSRFVVAFSPWCESIGRTEQRWPSAWSVPLAHAAARIRFELQQLTADTPPLPATTSRDEAFGMLAAGRLEKTENIGQGKFAKVVSADVLLKECFEQILHSVGFETGGAEQLPDLFVVAAAFIDDNQLRIIKEVFDDSTCLRGFDPNSIAAVILVASDMATPNDRKRLIEAGATAVISQLRFSEDLINHFSHQQRQVTA